MVLVFSSRFFFIRTVSYYCLFLSLSFNFPLDLFCYVFSSCCSVFKDRFLLKDVLHLSKPNRKLRFPLFLLRKEVIHPHVPVGIPCYDLTPVIGPTFDGSPLAVMPPASGITNSHGLTGGVYKARERIHRGMLIRDY